MSAQVYVPKDTVALQRILNSHGQPIDGKGAIAEQDLVALKKFDLTANTTASINQSGLYETGIKAIDLLAPIPSGGIYTLVGDLGLGKLVIVEELMSNLVTHRHGYAVAVTMGDTSYEATGLGTSIVEGSLQAQTAMIFEPQSNKPDVSQQLIQMGLNVAHQLREQGNEVLLLIDEPVVNYAQALHLPELTTAVQAAGITTLLLTHSAETDHVSNGKIVMSRALAEQRLYPAIDRLASTSTLLQDSATGQEHQEIAREVRSLLQQAETLLQQAIHSPQNQQILNRARRLSLFLTQPFHVAETFSGIPGEYLSIDETLSSVRDLLSGRYDTLPEEAFTFTGTIDQVIAKAQ